MCSSCQHPPMPETAATCRALLRTVGLEQHWPDTGADEQAAAWLARGDRREDRPAELEPDQWTMLRVCRGIWTGEGGASWSEIEQLDRQALLAAGLYLLAMALGAEESLPPLLSGWHR